MLTANYADLTYDKGSIFSAYRYKGDEEFIAVGDARFARREDAYVQRFYPDVDFNYGGISDSSYVSFLNENYPTSVPSLYSAAVDAYLSQTGLSTPEQIEESLLTKHVHDPSSSHNKIVEFLTGDHMGTNQVFATSMVFLCRGLGYHARYVEGYRRVGGLEANQDVVMTEQNHHYWVEVYYPNHGWKRFDPTPVSDPVDLTMPAKMAIKTIRIPYDGENHLPTLDDIEVAVEALDLDYGQYGKPITFAEWREKYLRPGDVPSLRFHPSYGDGYSALGTYHLAGIKLIIHDAWGNDVTSLYTGLDTSNLGTECYLVIYEEEPETSSEGTIPDATGWWSYQEDTQEISE